MMPKAAALLRSVVSIVLPTAVALPSILILTGEPTVKNRSDAFFSTINFRYGVISISASYPLELSVFLFPPHHPCFFFLFMQAQVFQITQPVLALGLLAFQFNPQPQLIHGIGIAQSILEGNLVRLIQIEQGLIKGLHAEFIGFGHDRLDLMNF